MNPLKSAQMALEALYAEKAEIEGKIRAVKESIALLEPFYAKEDSIPDRNATLGELILELENVGITEAIERTLVTHSGERIQPTQVRDFLAANDYHVKGDNPMATIHTVLKRLVARPGSRFFYEEAGGKTFYTYQPPVSRVDKRK